MVRIVWVLLHSEGEVEDGWVVGEESCIGAMWSENE